MSTPAPAAPADGSAPPAPAAGGAPIPLWKNLSFTLMWTSTAASGFGDRMINVAALTVLGGLAATSDSTAIAAGTNFWFFLPYIFFALVGGVIADRLPRKWVLFACDEARGLLLLLAFFTLAGAAGMAAIPGDQHWRVYAMLFAIGVFAAIFNPTRNAIVPQIVDRNQLQPANALVTVIGVVFSMIGYIVGAEIISPDDASSVRTGLLIGAVFYLVSGVFFALMRPKPGHVELNAELPPEFRTNPSFRKAVRYARKHRRVVRLIGLDVLVWSAAALVNAGVIGLIKHHYGFEGQKLLVETSYVSAMLGGGMLAGAAVTAVIRTRQESGTVIGVALICAGLAVMVTSFVPIRFMTYAGAFSLGVFGNVAIVTVLSLLQSTTPDYVRGSVLGFNAVASTILSVVIYFVLWRSPDSDAWVIYGFQVLGPLLAGVGLLTLVRYLRSGPLPTAGANLFRHLVRLFVFVVHRARFEGRHHIPHAGPVILAGNHTTALDPFVMQAATPRLIRWLMLSSYRFKLLEPFWRIIDPICLDMPKGADKAESGTKQVRQIVQRLKQGEVVGMFPEGHLQYDHRVLATFEDGVATCARLAKAAIVPCWIEGTPKSRSMLVHFLRPTHTTLRFGEPFTPDKSQKPAEITAELRRRMIALASGPVEEAEAEEGRSGGVKSPVAYTRRDANA